VTWRRRGLSWQAIIADFHATSGSSDLARDAFITASRPRAAAGSLLRSCPVREGQLSVLHSHTCWVAIGQPAFSCTLVVESCTFSALAAGQRGFPTSVFLGRAANAHALCDALQDGSRQRPRRC